MYSLVLKNCFELTDARAYALLRIGYGLSSLIYLILLWPLKLTFFSFDGIFPQNSVFELSGKLSEYFFLLIAFTMIAQIIGLFPRFSSIAVLLWHCSYSLLQPHEGFIRGLGLVIACSPGIDTWSVSSWLKAKKVSQCGIQQVPAYGLWLIQWQLIFLLANLTWSLFGERQVLDGTFASYYLMSIYSHITHPFPIFFESVSVIITYAFLGSAVCVPFFLSFQHTFRYGLALTIIWSVIIVLVSKWSVLLIYLFPVYIAIWSRRCLLAKDFH